MARRAAAAVTLAGVLAALAFLVVPFADKKRDLPAVVAQPPAAETVALVHVAPGSQACMRGFAIDEHSQVARIKVGTRGAPGLPLTLVLDGPGYHAVGHAPGGYPDNSVVEIPVSPPHAPTLVDACLRNDGPHFALLYGAYDRAKSSANTYVHGKPVSADYDLAFYEAKPASFADRAGAIADRVTRFRPGGPWVAWLLAALVLAGVPVALVGAVASAAAEDDREQTG